MNSHELYAELERVRREMSTLQHRMLTIENPDWLDPARLRLQAFEDEARDLVRQLAELSVHV
jgi:hypothetical protein